MRKEDENVYTSAFGTYREVSPEAYVSTTINPSALIVPANVSRTGQDQALSISPGTVLFTDHEVGLRHNAASQENGEEPRYLKSIALLGAFTRAAGEPWPQNPLPDAGTRRTVERAMNSDAPDEAVAYRSQNETGGFVQLPSMDAASHLAEFAGVSLQDMNIPQTYIDAWIPSITAHELGHINDRTPVDKNSAVHTLQGEIRADIGSLRQHFNQDYIDFVMDVQALRSLTHVQPGKPGNTDVPLDDHATHIWAEEFDSGTMPTDSEAQNIMEAPARIYERAINRMEAVMPRDQAEAMLENTGGQYAAYKALRENNAFADIPYANEFVDKYITAAERRFQPEILQNSGLDRVRNLLASSQPDAPSRNPALPAAPN